MTESNPPVTYERLAAALADEQEAKWRLRLVLQAAWRGNPASVEQAISDCGFTVDDVLPLVRTPFGGAAL